METGTSTSPESPGVQAFIRARQTDVLARAITTLEDCPAADLPRELHRLSGTLGTYQLTEARDAVRECESQVRVSDVGPAEIETARRSAVDRLGRIITTIALSDDEGESSP
jgi:hypothetical protein